MSVLSTHSIVQTASDIRNCDAQHAAENVTCANKRLLAVYSRLSIDVSASSFHILFRLSVQRFRFRFILHLLF